MIPSLNSSGSSCVPFGTEYTFEKCCFCHDSSCSVFQKRFCPRFDFCSSFSLSSSSEPPKAISKVHQCLAVLFFEIALCAIRELLHLWWQDFLLALPFLATISRSILRCVRYAQAILSTLDTSMIQTLCSFGSTLIIPLWAIRSYSLKSWFKNFSFGCQLEGFQACPRTFWAMHWDPP